MEKGRLYSPEDFHDSTEVGVDFSREIDDLKTNSRINEILQNSKRTVSPHEIGGLIADRKVQLYKARHPDQFFGSGLTDTAINQYEGQLLKLESLKKELEFQENSNPGVLKKVKNFFTK